MFKSQTENKQKNKQKNPHKQETTPWNTFLMIMASYVSILKQLFSSSILIDLQGSISPTAIFTHFSIADNKFI